MKGTSWKTDADGFERQPLLANTCRDGNAHGGIEEAAWACRVAGLHRGLLQKPTSAPRVIGADTRGRAPPLVTKPWQGAGHALMIGSMEDDHQWYGATSH